MIDSRPPTARNTRELPRQQPQSAQVFSHRQHRDREGGRRVLGGSDFTAPPPSVRAEGQLVECIRGHFVREGPRSNSILRMSHNGVFVFVASVNSLERRCQSRVATPMGAGVRVRRRP
jgi:hypothetical protein